MWPRKRGRKVPRQSGVLRSNGRELLKMRTSLQRRPLRRAGWRRQAVHVWWALTGASGITGWLSSTKNVSEESWESRRRRWAKRGLNRGKLSKIKETRTQGFLMKGSNAVVEGDRMMNALPACRPEQVNFLVKRLLTPQLCRTDSEVSGLLCS